ncbi:hypothetical protein CSW98_17420 [Vibrio sp. HA2012]|nr:hypothetical protein CSW98_17420 [Vibrio sp. HA2012]
MIYELKALILRDNRSASKANNGYGNTGVQQSLPIFENRPHNAQLKGKNQAYSLNRTSRNLNNKPNQKWHVFLSL